MKEYDATEQAYWNGYRKAVETFEKSQKTEAKPIEKSEAEIMKILESCDKDDYLVCRECPLFCDAQCGVTVARYCIDLINRKNAENERLEKEYDRLFKESLQHKTEVERLKKLLDTECDTCACGLIEERDKAKAEAIKELAKEAKELGKYVYSKASFEIAVDQIAKEMGVEL